MPVVIGGDNLPSPVRIGLTDLPNIGGPVASLAHPVPASLDYVSDNRLELSDHLTYFKELQLIVENFSKASSWFTYKLNLILILLFYLCHFF